MADAATIQLEFITLSYHTGNPIFAEKVKIDTLKVKRRAGGAKTVFFQAQVITDFLDSADYSQGITVPGLYPSDINIPGGYFKNCKVLFFYFDSSTFFLTSFFLHA